MNNSMNTSLISEPVGTRLANTAFTRRAFNHRLVVLGGYAAMATLIPFSTSVLARAVMQQPGERTVPALDTGRDEALGNYPGYSDTLGYGRAHLVADAGHGFHDSQLLC